MNKSSIILLVFAALGLGSLIGIGFVGDKGLEPLPNSAPTPNPSDLAFTGGAPVFRFFNPADLEVSLDEFGRPLPSISGENFIGREGVWKSETLSIEIPVDGAIEYKAIMERGGAIVYDWNSDGGEVYADFHGHDQAQGNDFFVRYEAGELGSQSGMMLAAFPGGHGWYWLNLDDRPLTITLRIAGFFKEIVRMEVDY